MGFCDYVLLFQTLAEETVSREIYKDTYSIVKEMLKEMTFKVDAGLSFKFTPTESSLANTTVTGEAGAEFSKKNVIKDVTEYSTIKVMVKHKFQGITLEIKDMCHTCTYVTDSSHFRTRAL